jgi:hypothetical protein
MKDDGGEVYWKERAEFWETEAEDQTEAVRELSAHQRPAAAV